MPSDKERFSHAGKGLDDVLQSHAEWLGGQGGARADLRRAPLSGMDLSGVMLVGADLREAELDGACLNHADLSGADLENARLDRASLVGARLVASKLGRTSMVEAVSREADLREADLFRANLERAGFSRTVLRGANLREARLYRTNLVRADLRDAGFPGADLSESVLSGAVLSGAGLQGARLVGADLTGADLSCADFQGADLRNAKLGDAVMKGCRLKRADLTGADLSGACIEGADLSGWSVKKASCSRLFRSEAGEIVGFDPGEFERHCSQPERRMELILHVPLTVSAAYLAKFIIQSINTALKGNVIALKSLEALSPYQTRMVLVGFDGELLVQTLEPQVGRLEKRINTYFKAHPLRKDHVYLGEMLAATTRGAVDFRSWPAVLNTPWQINPAMIQDEIAEEYRGLGRICEALHALVVSVLGTGTPGL